MSFDINNWGRFVRKQRRFIANNNFFNTPQITHKVSKTFEGSYRQDLNTTVCESPLKCSHLHFPGGFHCPSLGSSECDSEYSQKHINGRIKAGYQATFGHDEVGGDAKDLIKERGYFFGGFTLEREKVKILRGVIDGTCNTGIVHKPLREEYEKCEHVGRWYGRIHARVRLPQGERAFLIGSMAIDMDYNMTPSFLETKFAGTLEGMLIRECKKPE